MLLAPIIIWNIWIARCTRVFSANKRLQQNIVSLYTTLNEYEESFVADKVKVNMKYKMVDKKVKRVVAPLPKDRWQWMKEITIDPYLRDPRGIGHIFTYEM